MNAVPSRRKRANLGLLALEPRWMFDGAAAADAAHAAPDAGAKALIPDAPAPVQVRAADPSQDGGKKEVVFVDTSVAGYQTLEAAVKPGVEIEEIDGSQSGLAQMAKWAETHTRYDSITIMGRGSEATLLLGTDSITHARLSNAATQAELAEIGSAMKSGGQLLIDANGVGQGVDGQHFVADIATGTGAIVGAFTDRTDSTGHDGNWTLDSSTGAIQVQAADPSLNGGKTEVVFIDTSVADYRTLMAAVKSGIEIELIDGSQGGLAQIARWADTHAGYDSISILSHGAEGEVKLGTDIITDSSLAEASIRAELTQIGHSLKAGGDILLYGCDVAAGTDGQKLITDLAAATGADVAASIDATGSANHGGNWALERATGSIEATRLSVDDYSGLLVAPFNASGFTTSGSITTTQTIQPFSSVTISDTNASDSVSATITFTAAAGTLSGAGLTGSNGSYTLSSATPATLQSRLEALTFTPAQTGTVNFTLNLTGLGVSKTAFTSGFASRGVGFDGSGNIYAVDYGSNAINKYDSSGGYISTLGTGIGQIRGLAVDSSGNIFIGDYANSAVVKIDTNGSQTTFNSSVGRPAGMAVDGSGNVYVAGYGNGEVYKISSDGSTVTTLATGLSTPSGVAVDGAGNVYFCEYNGNKITKISLNQADNTYGTPALISSSSTQYSGIAVDKYGNIFATVFSGGTLIEVPYNSVTSSYGSEQTLAYSFNHPWGVVVDSNENIFVAEQNGSEIGLVSHKSYSNSTTQVTVSSANTAPVFVNAGAQSLSAAYNGAATDLKTYLHVNDADSSQTETWTQSSAPSHGTLSFSSATSTSGSTNITPGGTITYTPTQGYSGTDTFTVQVSDGNGGTATKVFNVTVAAAPVVVAAPPPPAPVAPKAAPDPGPPIAPSLPPAPVIPVVTVVRDPTPPPKETFAPPTPLPFAAPPAGDPGNGEKGSGDRASGSGPIIGVVQAPASIVLAPTSQLTAAPVEGAFRVPVISESQRAAMGGEALIAVRPVAQVQETVAGVSFALPVDTFAHTRADAVVNLSAAQQDGQPLPPWLNFNPKTGTFSGKPPADLQGTVIVRVVARDQDGREAIATIQIKGAAQAPAEGQRSGDIHGIRSIKLGLHATDRAAGKLAFTQQLKMASRNAAIRFV